MGEQDLYTTGDIDHTALFLQICFTGKLLKKLSTKKLTQKIKNVAIDNFMEQTTLLPTVFEQERP